MTAWQAPRCNGNFVRKVYDGLGQLIQEQRPQQTWGATVDGCNGGNNSSEVDVNYLYDAFGRQTRASVPVATALTYINRAAIWTQGYTETVYDATGRPARSFAPNDEQTDYGYAGRSTAVFAMGRSGDPNKVVKWQEVDGLGYLKRLRTYTKPYSEGGSVQATIDLSHDVLGNLRTVTHPNSIGTTTIDYDLASRKISLIDPDLGSWSYTYNRQNQLISQTDGRDKTICLYYDGFERLFGKRFPSNSTCPTSGSYQVLYNYDQNHGTNNRSRGQLTYVSNGNFTKWLSYNNKGLLDYETVRILGASEDYTTTYGYDSYLRLNTLKYPDDEIVTTTYNSMGLPRTLTSGGVTLVDGDTNNDDDITDTYDGANYDAAGRLVQMNFPAGGNLWQTRGYHGWTTTSASYAGDGNGRLYYIHTGTTKGGQDRLNLAYHYDSFGNLVYFHDNTAYHTLTYDEQNRITAAYSTSYGYDHSGRLTSYEGSSQPVNTTFPAHAIKKSGYSYAPRGLPNGNLVARAGRTLNWDHENRAQRAPVSVTGGGLPNESYIYDDDGIRVKKYTNGTGTYDPFPHYAPKGHPTGSTITKYYFFGGQRIAMRKGGTLTYLHSDHLGSTVLETNTSGNPTANQQYCAYGRKRTLSNGTTVCGSGNSLATDHTFTGQKLDATGLQYFNARYYDPAIGTFISPDAIIPDQTNVFDYNRYMMVRGNPLKYNDPSGHGIPEFTGGGSCAQIGMCYKEPGQLQVNPPKPSTAAVLQQTAKALSDIEIPIEVSFEHGAPTFSFDHNKFTEAVSSPLIACAGAIEGACGVAIGTSGNAAGAGVRGDLAVYADQHGNVGVFGEAGGGHIHHGQRRKAMFQ